MKESPIKINPAYATKLTTTLNLLRKANACEPRYTHLVAALGDDAFDHDAPISLLKILEVNGVRDCLWALRATAQNCDVVARLITADIAESCLHEYESRVQGDKIRSAAENATWSAWSAAGSATGSATWSAVENIVRQYLLP